MTNEEIPENAVRIMREAVERAIQNGLYLAGRKIINYEISYTNKIRLTDTDWEQGGYFAYSYVELIFSHEFARALWGEKEEWIDGMKLPRYLSELAFMVMQEKPLEYIAEFLREE